MNFQQALEFLYSRLPMFQRIGAAAYKADLGNTIKLCEALGNPQDKIKCIHIAGTNGKGSTSSMIASILTAQGYKTGLFTSPHLKSFTERIRIDGEEITEQFVAGFVEKLKPLIEKIEPSFFEVTAVMAFEYYANQEVSYVVLETGMGGRLDSTNVVVPILSVITNISWDHQQFLGDTLEKIAFEKAGIIKKGIPVVIGERQPGVEKVFEARANNCGSEITFASDEFQVRSLQRDLRGQSFALTRNGKIIFESLRLDLPGIYQEKNIATVLASVFRLRESGVWISDEAIVEGLANVKRNSGLGGRMTLLRERPLCLCDIAHNEAGVKFVLEQLNEIPKARLHMVWGAVNDKDIGKILAMLPKDAEYYFVKPNLPRGLDENELREKANAIGLRGKAWPSVTKGYEAALQAASEQDVIFIGGSTFVVAEVI